MNFLKGVKTMHALGGYGLIIIYNDLTYNLKILS